MKRHGAFLVVVLTVLVLAVAPAYAQNPVVSITPETCRAFIAQYGTTASDAALTFQGGSIEAQQVAFCQSLAFRADRDGAALDDVFTAQADTDKNGSVDQAEFEAYFVAADVGAAAQTTTDGETSAPPVTTQPEVTASGAAQAAGTSSEDANTPAAATGSARNWLPLLLGIGGITLVAASLAVYRVTAMRKNRR